MTVSIQTSPTSASSPAKLGHGGKVIVVASAKGGVGRTTVSTNLAAHLAMKLKDVGKSVCLVDTNVQNSDLAKTLGTYRPTVADLAAHADHLTPQLVRQHLVMKQDLNLYALLGPESPEKADPEHINGRLYRDILTQLRSSFSYIIVDTSVGDFYHDIFRNFIIPEMDYMMMLTIPSYTAILDLDQHMRLITASTHAGGCGVDPDKIGWVLNQSRDGVGADEREVREELAIWKYLGHIPYSEEWLRAANDSRLVATGDSPEITAAFDPILHMITGEAALLPD